MRKLIFKSVCALSIFALGFSTMSLKEFDGGGGSSTHTCYDTFKLGDTYINVNCNKCVSIKNEAHTDQSTCTTT